MMIEIQKRPQPKPKNVPITVMPPRNGKSKQAVALSKAEKKKPVERDRRDVKFY
jgi:hypothetical protein